MKKKSILILLFVIGFIIVFLLIYDNSCTVSFNTDGGEKIEDIKIKKGTKIKLPDKAIKKGYVFVEWQLNGKKFKDDTIVDKDITLKAKYLPEVYSEISFDTDGGSMISTMSILSGLKLDKKTIKEPVKDGYNFEGWYLDDKPFDFDQNIVGNITLKAHYTKSGTFISNYDLKIGDNVLIIGNYAASSQDNYAYFTKAIGWQRKILFIYENREYPYQVGNEFGTTGFFKVNSLKRVD